MYVLRPYQSRAFAYTLRVQHPALFIDPRMGKTLITLRRCKTYCKMDRGLITAPFSAWEGWGKELKAEGFGAPVLLEGSRKARLGALRGPGRWFLINWEGFRVLPEIGFEDWDVSIADESTYIKNPAAHVSNFYAKYFRNVAHRWVLSGSPDTESTLDYFTQLNFLDPNILGCGNFYVFRHKYCEPDPINAHKWVLTEEGKAFVEERLAHYCFFLTRADEGVGSIKQYMKREVSFDSATAKIYDTLEREFLIEFEGLDVEDKTVFAGARFAWMRRLCGGIYKYELIWAGKIRALFQLLDDRYYGQKVIIWCHFVDEIDFIANEMTQRGRTSVTISGKITNKKERQRRRQAFNDGPIQYYIAQPECVKFGNDLSSARAMIFYSTPSGGLTRIQAEDRIISVGKTEPVPIWDLIVPGSVEEDQRLALFRKESRADATDRSVKRIQEKFRADKEALTLS
jgi:hypothetical protein